VISFPLFVSESFVGVLVLVEPGGSVPLHLMTTRTSPSTSSKERTILLAGQEVKAKPGCWCSCRRDAARPAQRQRCRLLLRETCTSASTPALPSPRPPRRPQRSAHRPALGGHHCPPAPIANALRQSLQPKDISFPRALPPDPDVPDPEPFSLILIPFPAPPTSSPHTRSARLRLLHDVGGAGAGLRASRQSPCRRSTPRSGALASGDSMTSLALCLNRPRRRSLSFVAPQLERRLEGNGGLLPG